VVLLKSPFSTIRRNEAPLVCPDRRTPSLGPRAERTNAREDSAAAILRTKGNERSRCTMILRRGLLCHIHGTWVCTQWLSRPLRGWHSSSGNSGRSYSQSYQMANHSAFADRSREVGFLEVIGDSMSALENALIDNLLKVGGSNLSFTSWAATPAAQDPRGGSTQRAGRSVLRYVR